MRITKTLKALTDAMCQSEIELTKIARTLRILGFQPQSIRQFVDSEEGVQVVQGQRKAEYTDRPSQADEESLENSPCNTCYYLKKVMGVEEELSRLRLDLSRLYSSVTLLKEEIHRRPQPR